MRQTLFALVIGLGLVGCASTVPGTSPQKNGGCGSYNYGDRQAYCPRNQPYSPPGYFPESVKDMPRHFDPTEP